MWEDMKVVVRSLFPALMLLRLADQRDPAMDRLYFYTRRMDACLKQSKEELDKVEKQYEDRAGQDITTKMVRYFLDSDKDCIDYTNELRYSGFSDSDESGDETSGVPDVEYGSEMDDDESTISDSNDVVPKPKTLGDKVIGYWNSRKKKLVSDVSVTAWMLSPIPEIMTDADKNHKGEHRNAVDRLIEKWFAHEVSWILCLTYFYFYQILINSFLILLFPQVEHSENKIGELKNTFWEELDLFHSKSGVFGNRDHIWLSADVKTGKSHLWHQKNSLRYTTILGKLACRTTSKILGIGSAERAWGDVKHLKTNKRSHLSAERMKKQATIYGSHCVEMAHIARSNQHVDNAKPCKFWTDEDMDKEFDIFVKAAPSSKPKKIRYFKNWEEDWEEPAIRKKGDPVGIQKLLEKYGGLQWADPDSNNAINLSDSNELAWLRKKNKDPAGYALIAYDKDYDEHAADADDHWNHWCFTEDTRYCIAEYYKENSELGIKIIERETDNDDYDNEKLDEE